MEAGARGSPGSLIVAAFCHPLVSYDRMPIQCVTWPRRYPESQLAALGLDRQFGKPLDTGIVLSAVAVHYLLKGSRHSTQTIRLMRALTHARPR
jgi:hypothetical protein